jgi:hypothetical protein
MITIELTGHMDYGKDYAETTDTCKTCNGCNCDWCEPSYRFGNSSYASKEEAIAAEAAILRKKEKIAK